ncbi:hypothetical protein E2542_SST18171 [Spatholobus suberectus]|nr:hypothetical protein E2542_SST18171 [Spatholobus suberectus]
MHISSELRFSTSFQTQASVRMNIYGEDLDATFIEEAMETLCKVRMMNKYCISVLDLIALVKISVYFLLSVGVGGDNIGWGTQ